MRDPEVIGPERFVALERRLRRTQIAFASVVACCLLAALGAPQGKDAPASKDAPVSKEVRTQRLVVVDDQGVPRVVIGQDAVGTQRRSRAAGLYVMDKKGDERGGFSTMDDGSAVFAIDAPAGVGAPMRDRLGLVVGADGSSYVMVIDNQTRAVAKMTADADGNGGLQVFKWEMAKKQVLVKTLTYDGDKTETVKTGQ
jgi:hypothetical protein